MNNTDIMIAVSNLLINIYLFIVATISLFIILDNKKNSIAASIVAGTCLTLLVIIKYFA